MGSKGGGRRGASRRAGGGGGSGGESPAERALADVTEAGVSGMGQLSAVEKQAIDDYSTIHFSDINNVMRGRFTNPRFQEQIDAAGGRAALLDAALAKGKLTRDTVLYRGSTLEAMGGKMPEVGSTISDRGFSSTSPLRGSGESFVSGTGHGVLLQINAPRGAHAVDVSHVAGGKEHEILLPRNSKMKVKSVATVGGRRVVTVDLIH